MEIIQRYRHYIQHQSLLAWAFILFCTASFTVQAQDYKSVDVDNVIQNESDTKSERNRENSRRKQTDSEKKFNWQNFRVGGNFGLGFGNYTYVDISPAFGYWFIPDRLQLGISSKFLYQSIKYRNSIDRTKNFIYGGGLFTDVVIWNGLFARGEFELINKYSYFQPYDRVNVPHLLLGVGYMQAVGLYGNFYIAAMFDVLDSDESIYSHTFRNVPLSLKMGFGIGFPGGRRK